MSNYPDGMASARYCEAEYSCNSCGYVWMVDGIHELGSFCPHNDDDTICLDCGSEDTEQC